MDRFINDIMFAPVKFSRGVNGMSSPHKGILVVDDKNRSFVGVHNIVSSVNAYFSHAMIVSNILDKLGIMFCQILPLVVRVTLLASNSHNTVVFQGTPMDLSLFSVSDQFGGMAVLSNIVFQGIHKLLRDVNGIDVLDARISPNKDLGIRGTTIDSRGFRNDAIRGHRLTTRENIEDGIGKLKCMFKFGTHRKACMLGSVLLSFLDSAFRQPGKMATESLVVGLVGFDNGR